MSQRAVKVYLPEKSDSAKPEPARVTPINPGLRDFAQPWLDLNDKSVAIE